MLLILTILSLILIIRWTIKEIKNDIEYGPFSAFIGILMILALFSASFAIGLICNSTITPLVEDKRTICRSGEIISIKNVNSTDGRFILGSGYINGRESYYFFEQRFDSGLLRGNLYSRNCIIYQVRDIQPHIEWQQIHYRQSKWLVWPTTKLFDSWFGQVRDSQYNIFVPTNTVVEEFKIN